LQRLSNLLSRRRVKAVVVSAVALGLAGTMFGASPAEADPKQFTAVIGVGSDTTQDVMNALSGFANNNNFTPAQSTEGTKRQLVSWDALGSTCITPKAPGATIQRPNGSTNGRRALSRAIDGTNWGPSGTDCGGPKPVGGLINYARSSAGPGSGSNTDLTYIPFGRDALSYAYYAPAGVTPVTDLSAAQLQTIFSTAGPHVFGSTTIEPCSIQLGSGTYQFSLTAFGVTAAQMAAATADCTPAGQELQENDANALKNRADNVAGFPALAGKQVIIGFSAGNFISQTNGIAGSQLPTPFGTVNLGRVGGDEPYNTWSLTPTAPITPDATFYASTQFGRLVYNVLPSAIVDGGGNQSLKTLFIGPTSGVCAQSATIQAFGFLSLGSGCGDTTTRGPLVA
jgi:hypothetical protein